MQIHQKVESLIKEITKLDKFRNHKLSKEGKPDFTLSVEKYSELTLTADSSNHKLEQYRIEVRHISNKIMYAQINYDPYSDTFKSMMGILTYEEVLEKLQTEINRH